MDKNKLTYNTNAEVGDVVFANLNYRANRAAPYPRPYIVLDANENRAILIPCSSIKGKEDKYKKYDSNFTLNNSTIPPLEKDSFIHLNNMKILNRSELNNYPIISKGEKINKLDLNEIKENLRDYMILENKKGNEHYKNPRFYDFNNVLDTLLEETKGTYFTTEDVMKKSNGYVKDREKLDKKGRVNYLYRPMDKPPTKNSVDYEAPERGRDREIN